MLFPFLLHVLSFPGIAVLQYTQTFSLILLYFWCSYCVSFCVQLDGVCLSGNKMITYLLTYLNFTSVSNLISVAVLWLNLKWLINMDVCLH